MTEPLPAIRWDDPRLGSKRDSAITARYRRLQSHWRESVLNASPGLAPRRSDPVGSLLHREDVDRRPWLNFVHPDAFAHAQERSDQVHKEGGTLRRDRLFENLLSSMPLCFNVFGALGRHPDFVWLLRRTFAPQAVAVERVVCEWAPRPAARYLDDRTAFDAAVWYRDAEGRRCLLGIEVKYTDTFSPKPYESSTYLDRSRRSGWFEPDADRELAESPTNQLWRNALLAAAIELEGDADYAHVGLLHLGADSTELSAVATFEGHLAQGERFTRITLAELCDTAAPHPEFGEWAHRFRTRYLDGPDGDGSLGGHSAPLPPERQWPDPGDPTSAHRLSWWLVAELQAGYDGVANLVETRPLGGFYDCLELSAHPGADERIVLNRNGSVFVFRPGLTGDDQAWWWVWRAVWDELEASNDVHAAAQLIAHHAGLEAVSTRQLSGAVSGLAAQTLARRRDWTCTQQRPDDDMAMNGQWLLADRHGTTVALLDARRLVARVGENDYLLDDPTGRAACARVLSLVT